MYDDNFQKDLIRGEIGEELIIDYLTAHNYTIKDLRDSEEARKKDIDFYVKKNDFAATLEVKTEYKSEITGNVFVEYCNLTHKEWKGWYRYCEADTIVFVQPTFKKAHFIDRYDLWNDIAAHNYETASSGNAVGWKVPLINLINYPSYYCKSIDWRWE